MWEIAAAAAVLIAAHGRGAGERARRAVRPRRLALKPGERLRGAPAAQASPPDLVALLESAGGAAAVTSPRLAVPFHHALLQAQSGGRAAGPRARFPPPVAVPVGEKLGEVAHPGL